MFAELLKPDLDTRSDGRPRGSSRARRRRCRRRQPQQLRRAAELLQPGLLEGPAPEVVLHPPPVHLPRGYFFTPPLLRGERGCCVKAPRSTPPPRARAGAAAPSRTRRAPSSRSVAPLRKVPCSSRAHTSTTLHTTLHLVREYKALRQRQEDRLERRAAGRAEGTTRAECSASPTRGRFLAFSARAL